MSYQTIVEKTRGGCRWPRFGGGHHRRGRHGHHGAVGFTESEEGTMHGDLLFGVRRPLRFMAHKLDLDEAQVAALARILGELKTERAQAAVDRERSVARVADALEGDAFDEEAAGAALETRVASASRLKEAVQTALRASHAMLRPEQRERLAYLLRSGVLSI